MVQASLAGLAWLAAGNLPGQGKQGDAAIFGDADGIPLPPEPPPLSPDLSTPAGPSTPLPPPQPPM